MYGDEAPSKQFLQDHANSMLEVADRFGCLRLKIVVQSMIVRHDIISVENAADLFLLADAQNCALLKEASMDFFAANLEAVMATDGYSRVKESHRLVVELLERLGNIKIDENSNHDVNKMSVTDLWRELDKMGLDLDGSRDTLAKRLKSTSS